MTMSLQWSEESIEHGGVVLHGALTDLGNAVLVVLWAGGKPKLGTLTATRPDGTSSTPLGDLRGFLREIDDETVRIKEPLSSRYEIAAALHRWDGDKAVLVEEVKETGTGLVGGVG